MSFHTFCSPTYTVARKGGGGGVRKGGGGRDSLFCVTTMMPRPARVPGAPAINFVNFENKMATHARRLRGKIDVFIWRTFSSTFQSPNEQGTL